MKSVLYYFLGFILIQVVSSWCLRTIFAGTTSIQSVDFSSDGAYILTGQASGRVLLWKTQTLQILKIYTFPAKVWQAVFSNNQQYVAIGGQIDDVHIIDALTFSLIETLSTGHNKVYDLDFRKDSKYLLTCGDDSKTRIWNVTNIPSPGSSTIPKQAENRNGGKAYTCQFATNSWYAVGGDKFLQTYDNGYNKIYNYVNSSKQIYYGLRINPSATIFIAGNNDGTLVQGTVNSVSTNTFLTGTVGELHAVGYSSDSTYFAVAGSSDFIYFYNAVTSIVQSIFTTNSTSKIKSAQFSKNSNYFLAGNQKGTVYFFYRFCHGCPVGSYINQTVCKLCAETLVGCAICTNSTLCKSCLSGYYINSNSCKSCQTINGCANCVSSSNCTMCYAGYFLNGITCTRCLSVQYGCRQCTGPLQCTECDKNSYLNGSICIACSTISQCIYCNSSSYCLQCRPGYYSNAGSCTNCSSNINPYCFICQNQTICRSCMTGYRLNSSNLCQKCSPECLFCNSTNHCFDCISTMYLTTNFTCQFCVHPCLACNSATNCLQCVPTYYLSATGVCSNCPSGCLSCNTSALCQSCDVGFYLHTATRTCKICNLLTSNCLKCNSTTCVVCHLGYFHNNGSCLQCSTFVSNCIICSNTTICQQCMASFYQTGLTGNSSCSSCEVGCSSCNSSTECFSCKQGYYLSARDCLLCINNCLTCISSAANTCTSCIAGYYLSTTTTGSCISCSSTISNCTNCLTSIQCIGCNIGYFLSNSTTCTRCTFPCASCKASLIDCLTCSLGYYIYTTGGTGACGICNYPCSQCSTSASTCLNCVEGYYLNFTSSQCINCQLNITGCSLCQNSTYCILCISGLYPINGTCSYCTQVIPYCIQCNTNGNLCSLCSYSYTLSSTNSSCIFCSTSITNCEHCSSISICQTCQSMYYLNTGSCMPCSLGCLSCYNGSVCENCIDTYTLLTIKICQLCEISIIGCQLCSSSSVCTNCIDGYYLNNSQCVNCRSALQGCQYCLNSSYCISCSVFYQLQANNTCIICSSLYIGCQQCSNISVACMECAVGYFLNTNGICVLCDNATSEGCLKCFSNSTCIQCKNGYFLNSSFLCQKCQHTFTNCIYCNPTACLQCESSFYLNAGICTNCSNQGCEICLQTDSTKCVGCNSRYYLSNDRCLLCSQSISQCLQCNTLSLCLHCSIGYYITSTNICDLCSANFPGCSICSPSGCTDCMSNFFLNSADLNCHNCTDYILGCAFCISQTTCLSCQSGYFMMNSTCFDCSIKKGCLYCINQSLCKYCQQSFFLSLIDNTCYQCKDFIPACYACSDNQTCISCFGQYKLVGGQCQQVKGQVTRKLTQIGIKSLYVNETYLKHILYARDFTFTKIQQNWQNVCQLTLISQNYTLYILTILKVEWGVELTEIIFYTNNPIADQLQQSIKNMPFAKNNKRRLLQDATLDLGFNLKFMLTQDATHDIMPNIDQIGDLYLGYPYTDAAFYDSYISNRTYNYFIFGLIVTVIVLVGYTAKLCYLLPNSKERGSIIPHIFSIKCAALAVYPTYAEYVNYCYGFMTGDLPWLNNVIGQKFGNKNDVIPQPFVLYYTNLSLVSTYSLAFIVILVIWFGAGLVGYVLQDKKQRLQAFKSLIYNFFSLGAITSGCLSLQGTILNPIETPSINSIFYILGIALYLGLIVQIAFTWSTRRSKALSKLKNSQDNIGTAGNYRKLRLFIKATLLSLMHISPLYFSSAIFCFELGAIAFQHYLVGQQNLTPRMYIIQHIIINLALLLLILIPDALVGLVLATFLIILSLFIDIYMNIIQYKDFSYMQQLQIGKQQIINSQFTQLDFDINASSQKNKNQAKKQTVPNSKKQSFVSIIKQINS